MIGRYHYAHLTHLLTARQLLAKNNILEYFQANKKQAQTKTVYWGKI